MSLFSRVRNVPSSNCPERREEGRGASMPYGSQRKAKAESPLQKKKMFIREDLSQSNNKGKPSAPPKKNKKEKQGTGPLHQKKGRIPSISSPCLRGNGNSGRAKKASPG